MINHKNKFIYTRIGKTASTSVIKVLNNTVKKEIHTGHCHILDDINPRTKDYFKFTFVKNPWARLVSKYFIICQLPPRVKRRVFGPNLLRFNLDSFGAFAKGEWVNGTDPFSSEEEFKVGCWICPSFINQVDWISDKNGIVLTDFIGKVENLQEDFNIVCDKVGIPQRKLPHKHKSKHKHYTEYYDDETRQLVAEKYARDIEFFGYEFGE